MSEIYLKVSEGKSFEERPELLKDLPKMNEYYNIHPTNLYNNTYSYSNWVKVYDEHLKYIYECICLFCERNKITTISTYDDFCILAYSKSSRI